MSAPVRILIVDDDPGVLAALSTLRQASPSFPVILMTGLGAEDVATDLRLDQVAHEAGMSRFHFCRRFKEATGLTFREFLARHQIARVVKLLHDQTRSVSEVYLDVGIKNPNYFSRVFLRSSQGTAGVSEG